MANNLQFVPVTSQEDQEQLAKLAAEIWGEYWPDRIGQAQTDYMIEQYQSLDAIKDQMANQAYEYWFCCVDPTLSDSTYKTADGQAIVGFTGGHNEDETNRYFISKIYLLAAERGKHYASQIIAMYNQLCLDRGYRAAYLCVNKYNEMGVRAYKAKGFVVIDSVETDIGQGFIMDDYIMEMPAK